jgi:acyl carrier protein
MMSNTLQVITDIIADKLEIDPTTVKPESNLKELGLDSLDLFDLIFSAEEKFKIKVPTNFAEINTLQDVVSMLDQLIKEQHPS